MMLYVMDMKRQWFYLFSYDNTAIALIDSSRTNWLSMAATKYFA